MPQATRNPVVRSTRPAAERSFESRRTSWIDTYQSFSEQPESHEDAAHPGFAGFADEMLEILAPINRLERILADRVVLAAWRLERLNEQDTDSARRRSDRRSFSIFDVPSAGQSLRAERGLATALDLLEAARKSRNARWGTAAPAPETAPVSEVDYPDYSNEWTRVIPIDDDAKADADGDDDDRDANADSGEAVRWEDRLAVDTNVSQTSPVVRGTWVTAQQIVSLIVDGWTWSDILKTHPELTENDIRACLSYTVEQDEFGAI